MIRGMSARAPRRIDTRRLPRALPLFPSLSGYQRSWLAADALAAVTLLAIAVPEQLATSRLAGMPPITENFTEIPIIDYEAYDYEWLEAKMKNEVTTVG